MLTLQWVKCTGNQWCILENLNLESMGEVSGVYLIWYNGAQGRWVRVGSGNIKERLSAHRNDPEILAYRAYGLLVTWTAVHPQQQLGVEAYLAEKCNPLVGTRFPNHSQIEVNLPH